MSSQQLRDHEMTDILISPVGEMTRDTSEKRNIERAPSRTH